MDQTSLESKIFKLYIGKFLYRVTVWCVGGEEKIEYGIILKMQHFTRVDLR
jgi:hypothetical protein